MITLYVKRGDLRSSTHFSSREEAYEWAKKMRWLIGENYEIIKGRKERRTNSNLRRPNSREFNKIIGR